ncbi:YybH family protein [Arthrobacter sp. LjRoot14]|uniref:YybH family protein n=1 Tax=Arthrobacter sp. LjRoot14 TaxID=3342265 RepID=UPI003F50AEBC
MSNPAATPHARVLAESLAAWQLAFDRHRPQDMVGLFSRDALFQGLSPTLLTGREEIFGYYDALPPGITATFQIVQARQLAQHLVCGFAAVHFIYPDGSTVPVQLSLVLHRDGQTWFIAQYHASTISRGKQPGTATLATMMNPFAAGED